MLIVKKGEINLKEIIKTIKEGKVILFPTDTVYGLVCDAQNEKAVRKIFKIKKRDFKKTISIFVKDLKMAKKCAKINQDQEKLLKKFWPGKMIAVLKTKKKFPQGIVCQWGKIGLRIPDYKLLNGLLEKLDNPLAQTSANISGQPASNKIKDVLKQFKNQRIKSDLIVDAGNLKPSKPSMVLDLTTLPLKILRK